ncbi:MAG TPA: tRNA (adenine-N1)-methyltransferase [Actinopolymorphaceae bacterium]|nr:tRNA (adenine-N1)-methyltransferase [Actinopolymorphaceae bacterium]
MPPNDSTAGATPPPPEPGVEPSVDAYAGDDTPAGGPARTDERPLQAGEQVRLEDTKGRKHLVTLEAGKVFHTHRGGLALDDLIGQPEGIVVKSTGGVPYLALRPLLADYVLSMPRGATVVYPKDAAQILVAADIYPGARVVEAGAGSGALTCALLRAVGPAGRVLSYERRDDFAAIARRNVERFLGGHQPTWELTVGDVLTAPSKPPADRIVLDLLNPWDCVPWAAATLRPGGVLCCYVATTTQLGHVVETLRADGGFTEPVASETLVRTWHVEGLSVRPDHRMVGHTGFLVTTRRLAPGVTMPRRRRRPAPGAYGEDYAGPRPAGEPEPDVPAGPA